MSELQLMRYRLLVIPGGSFIDMSKGLTSSTTANIHNAVQGGLNYLGICAGAFLAGHATYNSLNLATVQFRFYSAASRGVRKTAVVITSVTRLQ
ncbi:MAG: BPL-N domain-containing protein [Gemmatimonadota bacterium]|nr:BPL-N domain-containing protein [Gemmatimonadota bacterium]